MPVKKILPPDHSHFRELIEKTTDAILIVDSAGIIRFANPSASALFLHEHNELIGKEFGHPVSHKLQSDIQIKRKDGQGVWSEMRVAEIEFNARGSFLVSIRDMTERKKAEEVLRLSEQALRESEEKFRQLAENVNAVFWLSDLNNKKMFYISPRYEKIWGRSCQSLYEDPSSFLDAVHPEDKDTAASLVEEGKESGTFDSEYRIIRPGGDVRWIRARGFPIHDKEGKAYRLAGIAEDITEQKKLEGQFFQSQKMEAVGQLAGGIAHDFNNLLTVINGYSEIMMGRMAGDDPDYEYLSEIQKSGERAAALTRQLLAYSRQQIIEPRIVDMNVLIQGSSKMLQRLIGENVELAVIPAGDLGRVRLDPSQLDQLVMNLSINARDAMPAGGKLIIETTNVRLDEEYTRQHEHVKPGEYVMLAVTDTGAGMTAKIKSRIFEPFFTTKESGKGTGLGLATCYGIVKQNGGSIEVYSEVGHGTTFKIYFPRTDKTAEILAEEAEVDLRGTETIFLVEDEGSLREFSEIVLKKNGYKVISMKDGESALRFIADKNDKIHLMLTDVIMPGMSAKELYEKIKLLRPDIKVLYMSGYTEEVVLRHAIENRSANFIQKPFTMKSLLRKVRQALDG